MPATQDQENVTIQALKLYNKLPQDLRVLSSKRFESRVSRWLEINPFYSLEEFSIHKLHGVWVSTFVLSFFLSIHFINFFILSFQCSLCMYTVWWNNLTRSIQNWSMTCSSSGNKEIIRLSTVIGVWKGNFSGKCPDFPLKMQTLLVLYCWQS